MKKIILCAALSLLVFSSCRKSHDEQVAETGVRIIQASSMDNEEDRSYSFISEPYRTVDLSFRVGGPVSDFDVQNGQYFQKGTLIAAIDDRDYILCRQRAAAIFQQAEAEYHRLLKLYQEDNVSGSTYEKAKADYEKAQTDYANAVNATEDTRLKAPFDGYIQAVYIERFQDVKPTAPIVSLIDLSKIKVEVFVPEEIAVNWRQSRSASCRITFETLPGQEFSPTEVFLTQHASENNISYLLTAIIDNSSRLLLGGMAGHLSIGNQLETLSVGVPQTAVCRHPQMGTFVWVVDSLGQVTRRPVKLGKLRAGNQVEVLSGIKPGEYIATTRLAFLSEHEKVNILE